MKIKSSPSIREIDDIGQLEDLEEHWLCPMCGQIQDQQSPRRCNCSASLIRTYKVDLVDKLG